MVCGAPLILIHLYAWLGTYTMMWKNTEGLVVCWSQTCKQWYQHHISYKLHFVKSSSTSCYSNFQDVNWEINNFETKTQKTSRKVAHWRIKPNIYEPLYIAWRSRQQIHLTVKCRFGFFSTSFKNGSLWNSDIISHGRWCQNLFPAFE